MYRISDDFKAIIIGLGKQVMESDAYTRAIMLGMEDEWVYVNLTNIEGCEFKGITISDYVALGITEVRYQFIGGYISAIVYIDISSKVTDMNVALRRLILAPGIRDVIVYKESCDIEIELECSGEEVNLSLLAFISDIKSSVNYEYVIDILYNLNLNDIKLFSTINKKLDIPSSYLFSFSKWQKFNRLLTEQMADFMRLMISVNQIKYNTLYQLKDIDSYLQGKGKQMEYLLFCEKECFSTEGPYWKEFDAFFKTFSTLKNSKLILVIDKSKSYYRVFRTTILQIADSAENIEVSFE